MPVYATYAGVSPHAGLTQGLQVEIDLGVLFRRVDANDKGGRINGWI